MAMAGTFALDTVQRIGNRFDAVQDHQRAQIAAAADKAEAPRVEGGVADGEARERDTDQAVVERLDAALASEIRNDKALPSIKQLHDALQTIKEARVGASVLVSGSGLAQGAGDAAAGRGDQAALAELMAVARLTYATYGVLLESILQQAESFNDQAWFWTEVEDNLSQTFTYLVQTLPARIYNLVGVVGKRLSETTQLALPGREHNLGAMARQKGLRGTLHNGIRLVRDSPALAIGALFPLAVRFNDDSASDASTIHAKGTGKVGKAGHALIVSGARTLTPLGLTRHEARAKRRQLVEERNTMAERLGTLAQSLSQAEQVSITISPDQLQRELWTRVDEMQTALSTSSSNTQSTSAGGSDLGSSLDTLLTVSLHRQQDRVDRLLSAAPVGLGVPTRLARLWPMLVLGPLSTAVAIRVVSRSWDTLVAKALDAKETLRGFAINWVYEPCIKLLDTIRTGDEEGVIMTRESLNSDLQSLERMVSDFSAEKYGLSGPELQQVAVRVREGDLTTVLRIYETELKSPLRSAISGSLIRSLLIQIQKVKVDIAVAMRGVDQLLKSQQLLFGAIGIAPAMGIIYFVGGAMRSRARMALGSQGRAAGQSTRYRAWEAMRRVDRLLADPALSVGALPPKTQGLLLLDLALLRRLAPQLVAQVASGSGGSGGRRGAKGKRLRTEFLRDVRDLESGTTAGRPLGGDQQSSPQSALEASAATGLGWHARRAAVDRMWKSWGSVLSIVEGY